MIIMIIIIMIIMIIMIMILIIVIIIIIIIWTPFVQLCTIPLRPDYLHFSVFL